MPSEVKIMLKYAPSNTGLSKGKGKKKRKKKQLGGMTSWNSDSMCNLLQKAVLITGKS